MEFNEKIEELLTREQKIKFQKDNGKFKILTNLVILPIITTLVGIYLESIAIVSVSIFCIIIFLGIIVLILPKRNAVYDDVIIPGILKEAFESIKSVKVDKDEIISEFEKSSLIPNFNKVKVSKSYIIEDEKYNINMSKVDVDIVSIKNDDGIEDRDVEDVLSGIFAYVKMPQKSSTNFSVIAKEIDSRNEEKVKITSNDFNNVYNVYAENQVEVRNILSIGVMARILEFNNTIGSNINFSIFEDNLYIAIDFNDFCEFKGDLRNYVDEQKAQKNVEVMKILNLFVQYFVNIFEK